MNINRDRALDLAREIEYDIATRYSGAGCLSNAQAALLCGALREAADDVGRPEEPMPAVAIAGERCECCGRTFVEGEQVASFAEDDVVACYGKCPEPEALLCDLRYTHNGQRRSTGPILEQHAVNLGRALNGNAARLAGIARVRLVRCKVRP